MTNVGLRFDKIGKDVFPRFIETSANLATVLKMEPTKAAEFLGKTLQDMATDGTFSAGRLRAAGLTITDAMEEQIAAMVKAGDTSGAMNLVMNSLAETTGGAAATAAGTAAGQWEIFQESIRDAGEGVMLTILPSLTEREKEVLPALIPIIQIVAQAASDFIVNQFIPAFQQAVAWLKENWPQIQATIQEAWTNIQPVLKAIGDFINDPLMPAIRAAVAWVVENWPQIQATIQEVMAVVQQVFQGAVDFIMSVWAVFQPAFEGDWYQFGVNLRTTFIATWEAIKKAVLDALEWFGKQDWAGIGMTILTMIGEGLRAGASALYSIALDVVGNLIDALRGAFGLGQDTGAFAMLGRAMNREMSLGISQSAGLPAAAMAGTVRNVANTVTNNNGGNVYNYYGVQADMQYAYTRAVAGAMG
jgi:hypothetical protein